MRRACGLRCTTLVLVLSLSACTGGDQRSTRVAPSSQADDPLPRAPDPVGDLPAAVFESPPDRPVAPAVPYRRRAPGSISFGRDVAPIVWHECTPCHHPGGLAPFPFAEHADVRKRARQIVDVITSRYMPPWQPADGYGEFQGRRRLDAESIGLLTQWVEEGAPLGAAPVPAPPRHRAGWQLAQPSLVARFPEPYPLQAEGLDVFRNLVIPNVVDRERYVRGVELLVNGAPVIHHVEIRVDATESSLELDRLDAEPGFYGMNSETAHYPEGHFLNWVPGKTPAFEPPGRAWRLEPGDDLVVQLHLIPSGKPEMVHPEIGLHFTDDPPSDLAPLTLGLQAKDLEIPAGEGSYVVRDAFRLPVPVEVINVMAHAHYLGRDLRGWAVLPDGTREWLLRIEDWDFNWQDDYRLVKPLRLPAGTVLVMQFTFDNSAANERNPSSPPRTVSYGPRSTDEMSDLWIRVLPLSAHDRIVLRRENGQHRMLVDLAAVDRQLARAPSAALHQRAARLYERFGSRRGAIAHLRAALRLAPQDAGAHEALAASLSVEGRTAEALESMRAAVQLDPATPQRAINLARLLHSTGRDDEAESLLDDTLARHPGLPEGHELLAGLKLARRDLAAAQTQWQRALASAPNRVPAMAQLALLLAAHPEASRRDPAAALELANRATAAEPRDPDAWRALAAARAASGSFPTAVEAAERFASLARGTQLAVTAQRELAAYRAQSIPNPYEDPRP